MNGGQRWPSKIRRFITQWLFFGLYVLLFASLFIILEDESQQKREFDREIRWNRTVNQLMNLLRGHNDCSVDNDDDHEEALIEDVMESAMKKVEAKWDQSWTLVNSLYYCSSLYTTVGKYLQLDAKFLKSLRLD